jgi:hypothetical protein
MKSFCMRRQRKSYGSNKVDQHVSELGDGQIWLFTLGKIFPKVEPSARTIVLFLDNAAGY